MINVIFFMGVKRDVINVIHGIQIVVLNAIQVIIKKIFIIKLINLELFIALMKLLVREYHLINIMKNLELEEFLYLKMEKMFA